MEQFNFINTSNRGCYVGETYLLRGVYAKIYTDDRGKYFSPRAVRPEVKKYLPRSEVYHLSIYTEKEVRLPHNFDFQYKYPHPPPPSSFCSEALWYVSLSKDYLLTSSFSWSKTPNTMVIYFSLNSLWKSNIFLSVK